MFLLQRMTENNYLANYERNLRAAISSLLILELKAVMDPWHQKHLNFLHLFFTLIQMSRYHSSLNRTRKPRNSSCFYFVIIYHFFALGDNQWGTCSHLQCLFLINNWVQESRSKYLIKMGKPCTLMENRKTAFCIQALILIFLSICPLSCDSSWIHQMSQCMENRIHRKMKS